MDRVYEGKTSEPQVADRPATLQIRELTPADLRRGFLETLASLAEVGLTVERAEPILRERQRAGIRTYVAWQDGEILGTASLFVERKFIHGGGLVGHVEDVAVRADRQGHRVGTTLVRHVTREAQRLGCYKVILSCRPERSAFYQRLGYYCHEDGMRFDCPTAGTGSVP